MESNSFKSAIAKATTYNQRLDMRLSHTGVVDAALFDDFASVQADPNASSVGWLQAKLRVLSARVSSGGGLSLYEPASGTLIAVNMLEQFAAWADRHFPITKGQY
ncbi:MAG: hypothetical protein E8D46_11290 [Nitrospira sp.]|nr:hypothetical protein [Nitrospira sp.]TKB73046.1 MAG: hypothetical protein E8D46_11290 [Nitrospira sp.]